MSQACSGVYREVARHCGMDVARALHQHYVGWGLKVPKRVSADHPIARRIGFDLAQRLCRHFGGSQIEIPSRWLSGRELERLILELYADDRKICDIAAETRCTRRHVEMVLKKRGRPRSRRQGELF
ncbi:Mor transcription activator family protein [Methylocystis sp. S23]